MSKCCIIDENNKMLPFSHDEAVARMTHILKNSEAANGIIRFENKVYEYIELCFDDEVIRILKDVTKLNYFADQNAKLQNLINELKKENRVLKKDNLTKLYRADCAMKVVREYILYAYDMNIPFSLVMADIDKFKNINDTYGHEVGNVVLESIGKKLLDDLRTRTRQVNKERRDSLPNKISPLDKNDIIIRYGGEEILFLIKNINLEDTINRIEYIREGIENLNPNGIHVTMSFGIFHFDNQNELTDITEENIYKKVSRLVQYADKAMYNSKQNGRNLTSVYDMENSSCYIVKKGTN